MKLIVYKEPSLAENDYVIWEGFTYISTLFWVSAIFKIYIFENLSIIKIVNTINKLVITFLNFTSIQL